ncbi:MAG: Two-component system, NarL family, sensor histidine kinase EvgS [uncultured Thiotrichaceae bacterium]|uniref:histidine kinase n=1 Tax=uncultured Thiotrichaceae bacterium TaxID=298394 RepID=A0A6S6TW30_9GAMM|nr:MAG: Two-component system, NarL family, sensor histidine kinase EvgS [uncultured Thiotrichaceae bacterium]
MTTSYAIKQLFGCFIKDLLISFVVVFSFACSFPEKSYANERLVNSPHFTAEEQAWMTEHPEISIVFFTGLPPYLMEEDGKYSGILADYAKLLSEQTGINFRIQHQPSWGEVLEAANSRKADIIGSVLANNKFTALYNFTLSTGSSKFYIFGSKFINTRIESTADLMGTQVGYIASSRHIESYAQKNKAIKFIPFQTSDDLVKAVANGKIDFFVRTEFSQYLLKRKGVEKYKVFLEIPELENHAYMAVRNDWPQLTNIINKVFVLNRAKIQSINRHWLKLPAPVKVAGSEIQLSAEERTWLAEHPVIRVGFDPQWAPIEFLDRKSKPQGISMQYLQHLQEILGIEFEYNSGSSWSETYDKLVNSELDLLPAVSATRKRRGQVNFTIPYLSTPIGIFSMVDRAYLGGLDALEGKRVVVVESHAIQTWLEDNHPELEVVTAPTLKAALRKVVDNKAYALVGSLISTSYYIGQSGLNQVRVVGEASYTNDLSMAVRKDWPLLPGILEKAIDSIPQSERTAIYNEWISIEYKHSMDYTLLWVVLGGSTFILLTIGYWNRRLKKEVIQRSKVETALSISTQIAVEESQKAQEAAQAKSDFLSNMSHEIRTPINAVIGIGHLLRQTTLTLEQHEYLNKITYSSGVLIGIINDILDFSKGDAGKIKLDTVDFSLGQLLQKIKQMLETHALDKGLQLTITKDPEIPDKLIGDPKKLGQILRNLIVNAIKFTEQGNIAVKVDHVNLDPAKVQLRFSVKDTGLGIRPEVQKELFQPFSQGDTSITRQYGGTGLGLAISQQLVQLMGGSIEIDSKLEEGSCFYFIVTFDISESQTSFKKNHATSPTSSDDSALITAIPALSGTKVLLVEDDRLNRFFQQKYLHAFGTIVEVASNGKVALEMLQNESFDIVLMDIQMPVLDGYEATRMIRKQQQWQRLPIIALTAHALSGERETCLAAGMNDYLSKPFEPEQLQGILLKWATSRCPIVSGESRTRH